MEIRPYQNKDYFNVRDICTETATGVYVQKQYLARLLYCDYYVTHEPENCFVAADEADEAIGYIICSTNVKAYNRYIRDTLKTIKKTDRAEYLALTLSRPLCRLISSLYPAHLHIDIKDGYQRMGIGTKLMDALLGKLTENKVRGVWLGVGAKNEKGVSFYKKYGFKRFAKGGGVMVFVKKLKA